MLHKTVKNKKTKIILFLAAAIIAVISFAAFFNRKPDIPEEVLNRKLTQAPDQVVIVASRGGGFGSPEETRTTYYYVSTDKTITIKRSMVNDVPELETPTASRKLTQEEYDALMQKVTDSGVLLLPSDISDYDICDGDSASLTFTLQDGSEFETGGYMPDSECFHEVFSYIKDLATEDMWEELAEKTGEYIAVYNEKPLYYDFYMQISDLNLSISEKQLEKIDNLAQFFSDLNDVKERWFGDGVYNPATERYEYAGNYALKIQDDTVQVYVCGEYVGTFEILDMSEMYADIIKECNITATEEQLRAAGKNFIFDADYINRSEYAYLDAYFHQDTLMVDGKQVEEISFWDRKYSFVCEDGNWNYYIQGEKVGSTAYIPPMEYYKETIEKYNITCPEDWFFTVPLAGSYGIFAQIEKFQEEGPEKLWYLNYDKETDTYSSEPDSKGEILYAFVGVSDTQYDLIVKGMKIGSFTID